MAVKLNTTLAFSAIAHVILLAALGGLFPKGVNQPYAYTQIELVGETIEKEKEARRRVEPVKAQMEPQAEVPRAGMDAAVEPVARAPVAAPPLPVEGAKPQAAIKTEATAPAAVVETPAEADGAAFGGYVIRKIDRAKLYPRWARERGYEGEVLVSFRIKTDGSVADVKVVKPCKCDVLNKAACEAIERAAPFNDGPPGQTGRMEVSIGFKLKK